MGERLGQVGRGSQGHQEPTVCLEPVQQPSWEESPDYHRDSDNKGLTLSSTYSYPGFLRVDLQKAKDLPTVMAPAHGYWNSFPTGTELQGAETLGSNTGELKQALWKAGIIIVLSS